MTENVSLKLSYAGETHRVTVALRSEDLKARVLSYELVLDTVRELFPRLAGRCWTLVYRDEEGDVVTLSHALEFDEACHVLLSMNALCDGDQQLPTLHFCVLARVSFREKVVAPVLQKVVELARLAREATNTLRNSELLGKGRESFVRLAGGAVSHAGAAINHIRNSDVLERGRESLQSARSGVGSRLRRASSAVVAGIERRRSASGSAYDPVSAFDPTEFVKPSPVATSQSAPSSEVAVTVDLRQSVSSVTETSALLAQEQEESSDEGPPALVRVDAAEQQTAYESDADTLCDEEEDREWDVVDNSGAEAIAETDSQWAHELDVLRGIMVHLDEELCCDLLERYNGNVEAVLVELTNM